MNTPANQMVGRQAPKKASFVEAIAVSRSQPAVAADSSLKRAATFVEPEQRYAMIAEAAYYLAEQRGFEPGHELEDWCTAEQEIDGMLTCGEIPPASEVCDPV